MAKQKKKSKATKKKPLFNRPVLTLLVVTALIVATFFVLEKMKKGAPPPVAKKPEITEPRKVTVQELKEPPKRDHIEHQPYTTVLPIPPKHPKKKPVGPGTVAIIIDDMGSSTAEAKELMAIHIPLTFSVIPGLAQVGGVVEAAHARGYQLMIHIPMEPRDYPQRRMEKSGLLLSQSDEDIRFRLAKFIKDVPYAMGANNHMGSRFTEDRGKMEAVLRFLKGKGLYFIDSRTSPHSVGDAVAREMGVETASRNVFIDNTQDVAAIKGQLEQLASLARRKGSAIGICHPHKTTIQALTEVMPQLKKEGITFVYAEELVR